MIFYFMICFFIGSIPFAYLISKIKGINIKEVGSGNSGATNVLRTVGWKEALLVMLLDIGKGYLAVFLFNFFESSIISESFEMNKHEYAAIGGFIAVFGHIFSPFLKFNGGKGVATSIGIYLHLAPLTCLASCFVALLIIYFSKKASLGTILGILTLPIFLLLIESNHNSLSFVIKIMLLNIVLILFTHRENIKRIIDGTELKIKN